MPLVVCVLGCRSGSVVLERRAKRAAAAFLTRGATMALVCGGRSWAGVVEADDLARIMAAEGVPEAAIVRERCSLDTRDNARFGAAVLRRRGVPGVLLVTCSWHLPRAERLFRAAGLAVEGLGVEPLVTTARQRVYRRAREHVAQWLDERHPMRIV